MLILTCASLSGGQGKTTVAILLGRMLAQTGQRVLMIDADPQANLTFSRTAKLTGEVRLKA